MKELFLLDPSVIFLNHGAFGACPRPVFEAYQDWQRQLECQPVEFLGRRADELLAHSRARLAEYLGAAEDEIAYFPNPTTAINMVARSLDLQLGDEILATDHEYGAMDRIWRFICRKTGAVYKQQAIPLPVTTPEAFVESFWKGVSSRTRAIFISHITSLTALIFPVEAVCHLARQAGILTILDGAHAPGQLPLNLREIGADLYSGACHKWLCAPKGAAFLFAHRQVQPWLEPLVVSWGYECLNPSGSQFIDLHQWQGTRDLAAFLSVPAAIEFQEQNDWESVRLYCASLAAATRERIERLTGLPAICPAGEGWFRQMFSVRLPQETNLDSIKTRLYYEYRIEAPAIEWGNGKFIRISFQGYNTQEDADALLEALAYLIPQVQE